VIYASFSAQATECTSYNEALLQSYFYPVEIKAPRVQILHGPKKSPGRSRIELWPLLLPVGIRQNI